MAQKIAIVVLGIIALLGVCMMTWQVKSLTGDYVAGGNVGSWYAGTQIIQLPPDEACIYAGYPPNAVPSVVTTLPFGTLMSVCGDGSLVPIVQTAYIPGPNEPSEFIG